MITNLSGSFQTYLFKITASEYAAWLKNSTQDWRRRGGRACNPKPYAHRCGSVGKRRGRLAWHASASDGSFPSHDATLFEGDGWKQSIILSSSVASQEDRPAYPTF